MGRYLIVANQTLGGAELERTVKARIEAGQAEFHIVVPMVEPQYEATAWSAADPAFAIPPPTATDAGEALDEARQRSKHRLDRMIDTIAASGGKVSGEIGDTDPVRAVKDVLERETFDEVIVSTLPVGISRWVKLDLPSRVARLADIPVTTVEAGS